MGLGNISSVLILRTCSPFIYLFDLISVSFLLHNIFKEAFMLTQSWCLSGLCFVCFVFHYCRVSILKASHCKPDWNFCQVKMYGDLVVPKENRILKKVCSIKGVRGKINHALPPGGTLKSSNKDTPRVYKEFYLHSCLLFNLVVRSCNSKFCHNYYWCIVLFVRA